MLRTEDLFTSHKARPTPTQGTLEVGNAPALGQRDAELILSFMTVPYLRIPLALSFFASNDRVHALQSTQLQDLLDGILFEGGDFATIIQSLDRKLFTLPAHTVVMPGHGIDTTIGNERPHLDEWVERGW